MYCQKASEILALIQAKKNKKTNEFKYYCKDKKM